MNKSYIKKWLFVCLTIILVLGTAGAGIGYAYKNKKLSQAPTISPSPTETIAAVQGLITRKTLIGSNGDSGNNIYIDTGDTFGIEIDIKGRKDVSGETETLPADIMVLIDNSESMERPGCSGSNCPSCSIERADGSHYWDNSRLCFAKNTTINFILKAKSKGLNWRIGYQQFSRADVAYSHSVDDFFRPLLDINDQNNVDSLVSGLRGSAGVDQTLFNSAMGMGMDMAREELIKNGRPEAAKYIILISDGAENPSGSNPSVSGYGQAQWPSVWPPGTAGGYPDNNYMNICGRLENRRHRQAKILDPSMLYGVCQNTAYSYCAGQGLSQEDCKFSCAEVPLMGSGNTLNPMSYCFKPRYDSSPADMVQKNNIKVFSIGYYGGGSNTNAFYLQQIAAHLYAPREPGGESPGYFETVNPRYLDPIFDRIIEMIEGRISGAPMVINETLPPGASVNRSDISVVRDGAVLSVTPPILGRDAQGRQTITINIGKNNYGIQTEPQEQTFTVGIKNIRGLSSGCHDADQNYNSSGAPLYPAGQYELWPSKVTWTFVPESGRNPIIEPMPFRQVCVGNQYSGDIYGGSIGAYAFPGIDVGVSGGANAGTGAIWNLSNYNFSNSSYSSQSAFANAMDKTREELLNRRTKRQGLGIREVIAGNNNVLDPDNNDKYADGLVFYFPNDVVIDGDSINIGRGNKTIIVDGGLTINTTIQQSNVSGKIMFLITNGTVIGANVKRLNAAVVVPRAFINITNSASTIFIKGMLVAANINLKSADNSRHQRINYDPDFALRPPPGLSSLAELPIFYEVAP